MSIARFSDTCDVYVVPTGPPPNNYCCMGCSMGLEVPQTFFCETAAEMLDHLELHRSAGDRIPQAVFVKLQKRRP